MNIQRRLKAAGGIAEGGFYGGVGKRERITQGLQLSACRLYFSRGKEPLVNRFLQSLLAQR